MLPQQVQRPPPLSTGGPPREAEVAVGSGSQLGCYEQPKMLTARMLTTENQEKHLLFFLYFDLFCSWFWISPPPFFSLLLWWLFLLLWSLFRFLRNILLCLFLITLLIPFIYFYFHFGILQFCVGFFVCLFVCFVFLFCCSFLVVILKYM